MLAIQQSFQGAHRKRPEKDFKTLKRVPMDDPNNLDARKPELRIALTCKMLSQSRPYRYVNQQ